MIRAKLEAELVKLLRQTVELAEWDKDGPRRPIEPYRWKTVALMALDYARHGLSLVDGWRCPDHDAKSLADDENYHLCEECNSWWYGWQLIPCSPDEHRKAIAPSPAQ